MNVFYSMNDEGKITELSFKAYIRILPIPAETYSPLARHYDAEANLNQIMLEEGDEFLWVEYILVPDDDSIIPLNISSYDITFTKGYTMTTEGDLVPLGLLRNFKPRSIYKLPVIVTECLFGERYCVTADAELYPVSTPITDPFSNITRAYTFDAMIRMATAYGM